MKKILKSIPKLPWIYEFFDKNWKIIYIWKSVNLFSRVNSYFNSKTKLNFAKKKMLEQIANIETIITNNETESLVLETTLIKKHKPKYNILMKDDKNYIYIKITDEAIAKIIKTRIKSKNWTYFWPYISTNYVNNILKIIKKVFWYRSCNIIFEDSKVEVSIKSSNGTKIPCIDYYIKRCAWPCLLKEENIREYQKQIENIKNFLKWDQKEIIEKMEADMIKKAKELNFEEANKIKEQINSIKILNTSQIVRDFVNWNYDIINHIEKFDKVYIGVIEIRDAKITWYNNYEIENKLEEDIETIIWSLIDQKEAENIKNKEKTNYIIPIKIKHNFSTNPKIEVPEIWWKLELLKLCYKNIYEYALKKHIDSLSTKSFSKATMKNILSVLWFKEINKDIIFECNDISHISWNHSVASRSVIENWKTNNKKYRKFKIKTLEEQKIDDFSSMREIMQRRIKEIEKTWFVPDLIIIDGWKWQLSSVVEIINNSKIEDFLKEEWKSLQIVSIAKKEEELFLAWKKEAIVLWKESNELRLIQKIRDEAHRFAITFNRDSRIKSMKKNLLESIPGIWEKTRKKIIKEFWSVENIKKEKLNWLISKNQIEALENHGII